MGQQPQGRPRRRGDEFGKTLRRGDLHQPVAAALLRRLDHRPPQPRQRLLDRLGHPAGGLQRHEPGDAQLDRLFDQPFLPLALGQGRAQHERPRQLAIDFRVRIDGQLDFRAADPHDASGEFPAAAVKKRHRLARLGAITWIRWCASVPASRAWSPSIGRSTKYRSDIKNFADFHPLKVKLPCALYSNT